MADAKGKCRCEKDLEVTFELEKKVLEAVFEINTTTAAWGNIQGNIENQEDLMQKFQEEASIRAEEDTSIREDLATEASIRADEDTSIREDLATEASIRADEDTSIRSDLATETSIRAEADISIASQLETEASIRAEEFTTLSSLLETETSIRADEDTSIKADISSISTTIGGYGDIVTHDTTEFATASQGTLADTALQPNDNVSELVNDAGYITKDVDDLTNYTKTSDLTPVNNAALKIQVNSTDIATFTANATQDVTANIEVPDSATWGNITGTLSNQTDLQNALDGKVDELSTKPTAGTYTKVTINNEGLVSEGTTLQVSDIPSLTLSKISDVTATASELNILDGATVSTAELNILDGITATTTELNYVDGVTSNIQTQFDNITDKIPSQASSSNQLADKEFVNSSIATNTANFIGTFENETLLEAYSGTVTNNDYAFVVNSLVTDDGSDWATFAALDAYSKVHLTNMDYAWVVNGSNFDLYRFDIVNQEWISRATNVSKNSVTLNTAYNKYKATVTNSTVTWEYEYTLNNSSFTAAQWAAINSGITSGDVTLIGTALQPNDNITQLTNNAGYITGITSSDVTTALGYTPYDASNPSGYTSNVGTVTSVNNSTPDSSGNVVLTIPTYTAGTGIDITSDTISIIQSGGDTAYVTKIGGVTEDNGVLSNFSSSNYAQIDAPNLSTANSFEIVFKFKRTGTSSSSQHIISASTDAALAIIFISSSNTLGYSIGNSTGGANSWLFDRESSATLQLNTNYWAKIEFTGTQYLLKLSTDGQNYNTVDSYTSSQKPSYSSSYKCNIGVSRYAEKAFNGEIDLKDSYIKIDGSIWWVGYINNSGVAKATNSLYGLVKPDNSTITINNGVISAVNNGTVTSVNSISPDSNGNVSLTIPSINSTNNYVPYRSGASTLANSTLMYNSSAMAFTGKLHVGSSSPSSYSDKGRFTIYDNTENQQVTSMALLNYGGGGGCGVAIDMYNTSANGGIPSGRFGVVDNGNYSGYLQLQVKKSGAASNPLLPAMNIVPVPASNSLTTCVSFGQDEFNRVLFDLHKPEAIVTITDSDKRWGGSGTTYQVTGSNKFNSRLLVAVGDIVSFDNFTTEATVTGVVSDSSTCQITVNQTLGSVSNKNISVKKAYFKITDESNNIKVYVNPYGKFGIGTGTPAYDLDVVGTINASTDVKVNGTSVLTGITSTDVTTALGYTPYDNSNPNGYTSNTGTVTSVNNVSPVSGNVTLNIPTITFYWGE